MYYIIYIILCNYVYIYIYIYISTPYTCATFQHRYGIFLLCFNFVFLLKIKLLLMKISLEGLN